MFVVYVILLFVTYTMHCLMARRLLEYYTMRSLPFHLNLWRWNKDVQSEIG